MRVRPALPLLAALWLLASALTPRPARAQEPGAGQTAPSAGALYHGLVIGNDEYESLPRLGTAAADARAVERALRESYGFRTRLLVNATRSQMVAALSAYGRALSPDASLLVYYAGRGHRDAATGKAYWLPVDAAREDVSNWVAADEITAFVRAVPARHVLVVSDGSYSGAMPSALGPSPTRADERERFLQKMAAGRSRTLMASGRDEPAAGDGGRGRSVFAAALLRGLREMEAPRFTAAELFVGYVLGPVAGRTGRLPAYNPLRNSGHGGGDFVFTRIEPAEPAPTPCEDVETKAELYRKFLDSYEGSAEQQKAAYEAGKDYVSTYDRCPKAGDKNVIGYIRNWMARYEAAVREWQRWRSRRP